jgi:hypothetical protein
LPLRAVSMRAKLKDDALHVPSLRSGVRSA